MAGVDHHFEILKEQALEKRLDYLHKTYLEKHAQKTFPYKLLIDSIGVITGIASIVFSGLAGLLAVFSGVAVFGITASLGRILLQHCSCLQKNQQAANALISPNFFKWAINHSTPLSTSREILNALKVFREKSK